jgi:nitric oxide reductase NorQ protein
MESVSTRLLIAAGKLIAAGLPPRLACTTAIAGPLSDEQEALTAMTQLIEISI